MVESHPGQTVMAVLGVDPEDEQLYRVVLRSTGYSRAALEEHLGLRSEVLSVRLGRLAAAGLVEVVGDVVQACPPEQAVSRLIAERDSRMESEGAQLETLRQLLPALVSEHRTAVLPGGETVAVEVVEGGDVLGMIRSLAGSAPGEMLWLRPDQWRFGVGQEIDEWVMERLRQGHASRAIYPARVLEEAPDVVRARGEAGEQVRVLGEIPARVAIFNRSSALMSEAWSVASGRRLVIQQEGIVAALVALFEALWERSMVVPGIGAEPDAASGDRRLLLDQLAAGAKDEQIARALGMSLRTVRRRVAGLLDELGVDSRFQAGVEAVRRGWL